MSNTDGERVQDGGEVDHGTAADFVIDREVLNAFSETLDSITDEAKLYFEETRLRSRVVDPANVAMADVRLDATAFDEYEAHGEVIGYPVHAWRDALAHEDTSTVVGTADAEEKKMYLDFGRAEITAAMIDPDAIRREPDIPTLDLNVEVVLSKKPLQKMVDFADMTADRVAFRYDHDEGRFWANAEGSTDVFNYELNRGDMVRVSASGDAWSLFHLDYLKKAVDVIPDGANVQLRVGEEFPMLMEYTFADGHGQVKYLQAPRVMSD